MRKKLKKLVVKTITAALLFPFPSARRFVNKFLIHNSIRRAFLTCAYVIFKRKYKYYLSLTICIKNEGEYIKEWIEYYLIQKVDHFYVYNNNGTDSTKEILQPYIDAGFVTWIDYPGIGKQIEIYNDAINKFSYETKWMGFIDADEFIVPQKHEDLASLMKEYEEYSQLYIYLVIYGSSFHKKKEAGFVIDRFTWHEDITQPLTPSLGRCIINPRKCYFMRIHCARVFGKTVNANKDILKVDRDTPEIKHVVDIVRINHYTVKSYEEWQAKRIRGYPVSINGISQQVPNENFNVHDLNHVNEPELMRKYSSAIRSNIANRFRTLVHVHIYYEEMWEQLKNCVLNISCPFKLYVTLVKENNAIRLDIERTFPDAEIIVIENRGYDIWPFVYVLNKVNLDEFEYVIKLHTKRNMHKYARMNGYKFGGSRWRDYMLSIVSSRNNFAKTLRAFEHTKQLGLIADFRLQHSKKDPDKVAKTKVLNLAKKLGMNVPKYTFVAGSMFMCRAKLLKPLQNLKLRETDFEEGCKGHSGGQMAHVIERFISLSVLSTGFEIKDVITPNQTMLKLYKFITDFIFLARVTLSGHFIVTIFAIPVFYMPLHIVRNMKRAIYGLVKRIVIKIYQSCRIWGS